jgi:Fe-S-cluster-containing dehydrogenase component
MVEIEVDEKKCSGCRNCQLWCSFTFQGSFNPLEAYIYQEFVPGEGFKLTFTEGCNKCGVCVDNCFYGALTRRAT